MSNKLDLLRERESALRAKIADEMKRQQRRQWRDHERLKAILGAAIIRLAADTPGFKTMIVQSLDAAGLTQAERSFLAGQGWQ